MRIYIPATMSDIASDVISERTVHAHTAQLEQAADLRDVPLGERRDVLEAMAMNAAADDSLRRLVARTETAEKADEPRRVVIAAEVADSALEPPSEADQLPTTLSLVRPVHWKHVESIHIDDDEALDDISAAMTGDEAAFERSYEYELMWYDVSERDDLISRHCEE